MIKAIIRPDINKAECSKTKAKREHMLIFPLSRVKIDVTN
jgi:hypothetical protein